jgi:hypothetical protein
MKLNEMGGTDEKSTRNFNHRRVLKRRWHFEGLGTDGRIIISKHI